MMRLFLAVAAVCAFTSHSLSAQAPSGNAKAGRDLYLSYGCYSCHRYDGYGAGRARLVPLPMTVTAFTAFIRNPPRPPMPAYSTKLLSDQQLADIWASIKSLPASPAAKDIPLLAQIMKGR